MGSCKNCGTSSLTSKTSSSVPSGTVIYDGINFTCATDPSLDTIKTDNLNTVLLRLFDSACSSSNSCCLTTTTYSNLVTLINSGGLLPNSAYRFPYQSIHLIGDSVAEYNSEMDASIGIAPQTINATVNHDSGTAVKTAFSADVEWLVAYAVSATDINVEVYSESFPRDVIYYDIKDDKTEDGLIDRPGFISYREDPDTDVSTHFDFRNILHRRFDMDMYPQTRDNEFRTALGWVNDPRGYDHEIFYSYNSGATDLGGVIPSFVNFNNGGNSDLGLVSTPNNGGYRDFKTFVGYGEILYKSPVAEAPRYRNIHIKKSDSIARVVGSASGLPITTTNSGTSGGLYPFFANVVLFTRSAENVSIGQNATGVTITGRAIREIEIGHNNENIIIGGTQSAPYYTVATEPLQYGFNENISIGNNNRNVMIGDANRRIDIGDNNTGIMSNKYGNDNTIGNYNSNVYLSFANSTTIGDWSTTVRVSSSNNVFINSQSKGIDVANSQRAMPPSIRTTAVSADIPDGFNTTITEVEQSNTKIIIGSACSDIFIASCFGLTMGSQNDSCFIVNSTNVEMGNNNGRIDIETSPKLRIGDECINMEVVDSISSKVGSSCSNIKILNAWYVNVGNNCGSSIFSNGGSDITVGDNCNLLAVTFGFNVSIGKKSSNITARSASGLSIGNEASNMFFEGASDTTIGNDCSGIVINTVGLRFDPSFLNDLGQYNYALDNTFRNLSGRTYVGSANPTNAPEYTVSLANYISEPNLLIVSDNVIGDKCTNIGIINSTGNIIGSKCDSIYIGEEAASSLNYSLTFTAGIADPVGSTPAYTVPNVTALAVQGGINCNDNVIGSSSSGVKIRGNGQNNNIFGPNVNGIEAVPAFVFINNSFSTDGAPIVLTAAYNGKIYNKVSPDGSRWESSIDNAGAISPATKLV